MRTSDALKAREEAFDLARQVAAIVRGVIPDPAYHVFLFGSWATGAARERSDIDIGIQGPACVDAASMQKIREACDALPTLYTIDVVDMAQLAPAVRQAALSRRRVLEAA